MGADRGEGGKQALSHHTHIQQQPQLLLSHGCVCGGGGNDDNLVTTSGWGPCVGKGEPGEAVPWQLRCQGQGGQERLGGSDVEEVRGRPAGL